jgi:uncharacterized YigZ family protein
MTEARYLVPAAEHRVEEEVLRSRFITTVARATTLDEARARVERLRQEFPDANHHCWACVAGAPGSTVAIAMSDDGEPHGTAGRPMLNALLHGQIGEVVAVVTRYFGGTLLGKGGLVRAYTSGVTTALATLPTKLRVSMARVAVEVEYAHVDALRRALPAWEAVVLGQEFSSTVGHRIELPAERVEGFAAALRDLTAGDVLYDVIDRDP